jgi:hypothetical protein
MVDELHHDRGIRCPGVVGRHERGLQPGREVVDRTDHLVGLGIREDHVCLGAADENGQLDGVGSVEIVVAGQLCSTDPQERYQVNGFVEPAG